MVGVVVAVVGWWCMWFGYSCGMWWYVCALASRGGGP